MGSGLEERGQWVLHRAFAPIEEDTFHYNSLHPFFSDDYVSGGRIRNRTDTFPWRTLGNHEWSEATLYALCRLPSLARAGKSEFERSRQQGCRDATVALCLLQLCVLTMTQPIIIE